MIFRGVASHRFPGVVVLLAGLTYLVSAAADPIVHAFADPTYVSGPERIEGRGAGTNAAGGPSDCLLCKVSTQRWIPLLPAGLMDPGFDSSVFLLSRPSIRTRVGIFHPRPRAPPHPA